MIRRRSIMRKDVVATNDILNGLLAHYTLDADGTDSSGNNRNAIVYGAPTYEVGKVNNAVNLNGTTQYLEEAGAEVYMNSLTTFSICCWANLRANADTPVWCLNGAAYGSTSDSTGNLLRFDSVGSDTAATDCFKFSLNGSHMESESFSYTVAVWHHLAITWTSGTTPILYVDGVSKAWGNPVVISGGITVDTLGIGRGNKSGFMNGLMDDFRVYNRELSSSEVTEIYNLGTI